MIPIALLRRRLAGAAAPLFLLLATRPLDAQTPRDTVALPEVTVTATRYPVPSDSLAATLTVLHGEELRAEGIRFVSDALRQVPCASPGARAHCDLEHRATPFVPPAPVVPNRSPLASSCLSCC